MVAKKKVCRCSFQQSNARKNHVRRNPVRAFPYWIMVEVIRVLHFCLAHIENLPTFSMHFGTEFNTAATQRILGRGR